MRVRFQRHLGRSRNKHGALARALCRARAPPRRSKSMQPISRLTEFAARKPQPYNISSIALSRCARGALPKGWSSNALIWATESASEQTIGPLGQRNRFCRVSLPANLKQKADEALHRRNAAGDSRRGTPCDQVGLIGDDIGSRQSHGANARGRKKREVIAQIRLVRRKREARRPTLNAKCATT